MQARSAEMTGRLREKFGLDHVEADFVVLVGRNGGLCLAGSGGCVVPGPQVGSIRVRMAVSRWVNGLRDKLGPAGFTDVRAGARGCA